PGEPGVGGGHVPVVGGPYPDPGRVRGIDHEAERDHIAGQGEPVPGRPAVGRTVDPALQGRDVQRGGRAWGDRDGRGRVVVYGELLDPGHPAVAAAPQTGQRRRPDRGGAGGRDGDGIDVLPAQAGVAPVLAVVGGAEQALTFQP